MLRVGGEFRVPVVILCGERRIDAPPGARVASLTERFGLEAARDRPRAVLESLAAEVGSAFLRERVDAAEGR